MPYRCAKIEVNVLGDANVSRQTCPSADQRSIPQNDILADPSTGMHKSGKSVALRAKVLGDAPPGSGRSDANSDIELLSNRYIPDTFLHWEAMYFFGMLKTWIDNKTKKSPFRRLRI